MNHKIYIHNNIFNIEMFPSDPLGSLDVFFNYIIGGFY